MRSVIEAYSRNHGISEASEASACGLWFGEGSPATLRVTDTSGGQADYTIDRME